LPADAHKEEGGGGGSTQVLLFCTHPLKTAFKTCKFQQIKHDTWHIGINNLIFCAYFWQINFILTKTRILLIEKINNLSNKPWNLTFERMIVPLHGNNSVFLSSLYKWKQVQTTSPPYVVFVVQGYCIMQYTKPK